jgi:hypothetical protein
MPDVPEADGLEDEAFDVVVLAGADADDEDDVEEPPPQAATSRAAATRELASQARGCVNRAMGMSVPCSFVMRL